MSNKRSIKLLLEDILESSNKILLYTQNITYNEFIANSMIIDAVIRNFEIIGEASSRLPSEFKDIHTKVDWFRVKGFRNKIVHEYFGIDYEIVWLLKETQLNVLISEIESIINYSNL